MCGRALFSCFCGISLLCGILYAHEVRPDTRHTLLQEVQETWELPHQDEESSAVAPPAPAPSREEDCAQKTRKIIIPKLTLDNLPFCQALRVLNEIVRVYDLEGSGINFILIDPQKIAPNVDLNVQSVSLEKIIHYLCEMTQFSVIFDENSIVFRDKNITSALATHVFPIARGSVLQLLNFTKESEAIATEEERLKQFFEKIGLFSTMPGAGFAYDGQNIIVTHKSETLQCMEAMIRRYQRCQQIAIEAKFLEIQQGVLEETGIRWHSGAPNQVKLQTNGGLRELSQLSQNLNNTNAGGITLPQFPNALNFGMGLGHFLEANTILNRYQMNILLRSIEQRTDADLMSAPKVTVLSGRKAEIVVAQELRYPESYRDGHAEVGQVGSAGTSGSAGTAIVAGVPEKFVTRNIGVEMSVIPLVEEEDHIHLTLEPCVTEFEGFVQYGGENVVTYGNNTRSYNPGYYQPIFSTRRIKTEVSLKNGSTLVMGGLTREEVKETHDKIPFFSQIPLLGKLFSSKGQTSQKKNLLIFVTANLVDESGKYAVTPELAPSQML